ncbi:MAG: zinc-dependent metalloprotease [Deltaproteobacteria bacterium]|nr:zinc-dependent metalloprotease [Deltaproteobacteria bacterium]
MKSLSRIISLAVLASLTALGCAQNVGDINRVQPNYVKKSDFEGEWYIRQTIADVGPSVSFSFVGMTLNTEKVKWEITEHYLIGYRSYELFPGMNPKVDHEGKTIDDTDIRRDAEGNPILDDSYYIDNGYKDAPIAAYRVQSHFDIQRQYNPATGEQSNVITENMSDRHWYDREYMRVDFSQNLMESSNDNATDMGTWEYVQESAGGEWAFRMETAEGEAVIVDPTDPGFSDRTPPAYIDVVSRGYIDPATYWIDEDYGVPACWLIGEAYDCASGEAMVRTSILKIPETRTFDPVFYDDKDMVKFGYFRTERETYDRRLGRTDEGQILLANIHHIWETDFNADGSVMPKNLRTPKPIVYALSANWPKELVGAAEWTARGWSKALARAVAAAQMKPVETVLAQFPYEDANGNYLNTGLFQIDYNEDGHAKIGDLRHNFMYWVDQPQLSSPLGYGPSSVDPETGVIVAGQAYIYGAPIDTYAQRGLEIVDALNGELTIDELITGDDIRDQIIAGRDRTDPRAKAERAGLADVLEKPILDGAKNLMKPQHLAKIEALKQFGLETLKEDSMQRLRRIEGTPFESYMINDEIRAVVAQKFKNMDLVENGMTPELLAAAKPYTLDADKLLRDQQIRQDWAAKNSIWLADFEDPSIFGLAQDLAGSGMDREQMYQWLRNSILRAVTEHEVGHTMGLRHNFNGSYDAINFFPEYWELRKENLNTSLSTIGDLFDMSELTSSQIAGKMREFQYSSIMDYGRAFNSDIHGLGPYDEAAILYAYGDSVEVFREVGSGFRNNFMDTIYEERGSLAYSQFLDDIHYTWVPVLMGDGNIDTGIERLYDRIVMPAAAVKASREAGDTSRLLEVPYMFCSDEWVGVDASCHRWDEGSDMWEQSRNVQQSWRNYYWFNNFRRNKRAWSPYDVYARSAGRYFNMMPNFYQTWLFDQFYTQADNIQANYKAMGAFEGFNFLMEVLSMPAYGSYDYDAATNQYQYAWTYSHRSGEDLYLDRGNDARRPYTRYDYQRGYYYWYYPQEASHFWDYYAALLALSQSSATVRGANTQSDFSSYLIPYYLVFDNELTRVYNGIIGEEYRSFAPRFTGTGGNQAVVQRPAFDWLDIYPEGSSFIDLDPVVVPEINFTNRFYALLFGMSSFTSSYSLNFPDDRHIFRLGSGETLEAGPGFDVITFSDPTTGVVYAALQAQNAEANAATKMIQRANQLLASYQACGGDAECESDWTWQIANEVEWMNIERAMYDIFGSTL